MRDPEFEMWNPGAHACSGVACADCHIPYGCVGALKISDHHVRSPLRNINRACQTCHKGSEDELRARVLTIQPRTYELRTRAMDALAALIADLKKATEAGRSGSELPAAARILGALIDFTRQGQLAARHARPR
jgi:nitrite reductase (cytochrome c-552)